MLNSLKYWGRNKPVEETPEIPIQLRVIAKDMRSLADSTVRTREDNLLEAILLNIENRAKAGYTRYSLFRCPFETDKRNLTVNIVTNVKARLKAKGFTITHFKLDYNKFDITVSWEGK
jgi:hypothetical protein